MRSGFGIQILGEWAGQMGVRALLLAVSGVTPWHAGAAQWLSMMMDKDTGWWRGINLRVGSKGKEAIATIMLKKLADFCSLL